MIERFRTPAALPNEFERELLSIFIEECMEAGIRASKAKRFGVSETQPGQELDNSQRLGNEVGDVLVMIDLMLDWGLIDEASIEAGMVSKHRQLSKFMQHQPKEGLWSKHKARLEQAFSIGG